MEVLRLVVSVPRPMAGTDFNKYMSDIKDSCSQGYLVSVLAGAYLHGEVESSTGYDIVAVLNGEECIDPEDLLYKEGIYEAEVKDYKGKCIAYLWNSDGRPRGLIVDTTDTESVKFAENKYKNKEYIL